MLIPILLAVFGLGGGIAAGMALRPGPDTADPAVAECTPVDPAVSADVPHTGDEESVHDFVKLNNQFIVPVVKKGEVGALVILSISLEVDIGKSEQVYSREPKIRDAFLQVLFDHANIGGFDGAFTDANNMDVVRNSLREVAQKILGKTVKDVLIVDIVRQDT